MIPMRDYGILLILIRDQGVVMMPEKEQGVVMIPMRDNGLRIPTWDHGVLQKQFGSKE